MPSIARVTRSSAAINALVAGAAVLAGTAVGLLRQPGAGALDTVWAEDGAVFLGEATRHGALEAVGMSYAGYFHLVPRLLTAVATLFPPSAAATVLAIEAALVVASLAVLVYASSAELLRSPLSRFLVAAPVVVVPVAQSDVLNSVANLHWYGLYALFWILLWRPASAAAKTVAVLLVALVATSDILVLTFLPLAVYEAWRSRQRHAVVLAGVLGAGVAAQLLGLATGASERPLDPDPVRAVTGVVLSAVPAPLIGERWLGTEVDARWIALAGLAWLLVAAAVVVALARLTRPDWRLALLAAGHAAALYALPVLLSGVATPRYTVAPALLVVTALVALLQPARSRVPVYALTVLLALVWAVNLRVNNSRADGPRWSDELPAARQRCTAESVTTVPISPAEEHWTADLSCRYLTR